MITIALGSQSAIKKEAMEHALKQFGIDAQITAVQSRFTGDREQPSESGHRCVLVHRQIPSRRRDYHASHLEKYIKNLNNGLKTGSSERYSENM